MHKSFVRTRVCLYEGSVHKALVVTLQTSRRPIFPLRILFPTSVPGRRTPPSSYGRIVHDATRKETMAPGNTQCPPLPTALWWSKTARLLAHCMTTANDGEVGPGPILRSYIITGKDTGALDGYAEAVLAQEGCR